MMRTVWVEIPVSDIERATKFYGALLQSEFPIYDDGVRRTAMLTDTAGDAGVGASLTQSDNFLPSDKGPLVYIGAGDDLSEMLVRVEPAGGKIVNPKTAMGDAGFYATIQDTEGNVLALHSMS